MQAPTYWLALSYREIRVMPGALSRLSHLTRECVQIARGPPERHHARHCTQARHHLCWEVDGGPTDLGWFCIPLGEPGRQIPASGERAEGGPFGERVGRTGQSAPPVSGLRLRRSQPRLP